MKLSFENRVVFHGDKIEALAKVSSNGVVVARYTSIFDPSQVFEPEECVSEWDMLGKQYDFLYDSFVGLADFLREEGHQRAYRILMKKAEDVENFIDGDNGPEAWCYNAMMVFIKLNFLTIESSPIE